MYMTVQTFKLLSCVLFPARGIFILVNYTNLLSAHEAKWQLLKIANSTFQFKCRQALYKEHKIRVLLNGDALHTLKLFYMCASYCSTKLYKTCENSCNGK
jgi:hypothetical protein